MTAPLRSSVTSGENRRQNPSTQTSMWLDPAMPVLQGAFDDAYLILLEESRVSLDDQHQASERVAVIEEIYGALNDECERSESSEESHKIAYFQEHAFSRIQSLLEQRLESQNASFEAKEGSSVARLVPALEEVPEDVG